LDIKAFLETLEQLKNGGDKSRIFFLAVLGLEFRAYTLAIPPAPFLCV
jgi:hypothetical protein